MLPMMRWYQIEILKIDHLNNYSIIVTMKIKIGSLLRWVKDILLGGTISVPQEIYLTNPELLALSLGICSETALYGS